MPIFSLVEVDGGEEKQYCKTIIEASQHEDAM
jgi:hypothetical protein